MKNFEIGIDLGTTNSEVAVMQNGNVEIIANAFGDFYTPSVVGINKAHNIVVGKRAFEALNRFASSDELLNNKAEIKRLMGTATAIKFSRTNKTYLPEEISAEILKSLRADVLSKYPNINVDAVVITIPAHFSTVQAEATKRAGLLAGFSNVLLLQEPIAAAISYGFNKNLNENWLVYDLGGGTFDVALISSKDGDLKVLEHNGDNFLGGKDLDLAIIDEFVVPYIRENFNLHDFSRGNKKYKAIFSKLKYSVEQAKVMLSRMEKAEIECDFCVDGKDIFDTIILTQNDLEKIATPLIKKTIALCNETIKTSGIDKKNIDRIILVGGSTQLDCLRKQLKDSLDIYVDMSTNPLTAVAVGACIYASGQQMEDIPNSINENLYKINVYFEALSAEKEELIVGELPDFQDTSSDFYIQIRNVSNTFNSGKLKLTKGKFKLYVPLEAKKLNQFFIDLFDNLGNSLTLSQNSITIIQGLNICAAPLPKSVGISFFEEDFFTKEKRNIYEVVFAKNSTLPLTKTILCKTAKTIKSGRAKENLGIYVYEGESPFVDRNTEICSLEIEGTIIKQDIFAGSDVEITLSIDQSRALEVKAYFPDLNQEFNARGSIYDPDITLEQLQSEFEEINTSFNKIQNLCASEEKISLNNDICEIQTDLLAANIDNDDKCKVQNKLKQIKIMMDNISSENQLEKVSREFNFFYENRESIEALCPNDDYITLLQELFTKGLEAQRAENISSLIAITQELDSLNRKLLFNDKNFLLAMSADLYQNQDLQNNSAASPLFLELASAVKNNDIETMKRCLYSLLQLLPQEKQSLMPQKLSGIKKI